MTAKQIKLGDFTLANDQPFVLFAGMNVLESRDLAMTVAEQFHAATTELNIPYVFKASFDKANRSSVDSYRGPGLDEGLKILAEIKAQFSVPIITDIHEIGQVTAAAEVADILQLPAFLSRQTDLVVAMAKSDAIINIKKAQFLAPQEMGHILRKFEEAGNERLILCERGSSFGYNNLVVDMLGFSVMKQFNCPLMFDATHALQKPGELAAAAGGRRADVTALSRAGLSQGIAGLFIEAHPDPDKALCDGPCALRLNSVRPFLQQMRDLDALIKSMPDLNTA
jgi:2-dehydro-3-deoxyphosphooctonate aldolase (KDO 8-P synthase)